MNMQREISLKKKETGDLIFKGRSSGFLKINGERIDPSRTVDILLSQKDVEDAYLWVVSCPPFDQVFAAIKTDGTSSIDKRTLRQVVSNSGVLPRPTRYIFLSPNEWPITDRGKIDHNKISELTNKENQK
ncbi:hypothetical protein CMUST_14505 [Corynebacterium mustelae]|uniref:AMP-binding enzyme C-terminal domain-containing protein n=1 Tax=Corynebacterium mustelae TaxID=571915 RepID=A0A0G3H1C5_9CORY|nr:amino acid adenylation domain-containing protein [Corynebacterium mustelae]AKK07194.1 hypothetical protein CMUST_14505 [Corynebacterium mustelae]